MIKDFKFDLQMFAEPADVGLMLKHLEPAMKLKYLPKMIRVTNERNYLRNEIERRGQSENVGKEYEKKFQIGKSEGFGMRPYNAKIPAARQSRYAKLKGTVKHQYGRIRIWGANIDFTNADWKAVVDGVKNEIKSYVEAYKTNITRMMIWDGGESPLAVASACTDANPCVVTLDDTNTRNPVKYLRVGMPIDFIDPNSNQVITNGKQVIDTVINQTQFTFVATDSDGDEITGGDRTALATAIANAKIYREGNYNAEWHGLWSIFGKDNNTIADINRALDSSWWYRPEVWRVASTGGIEKNYKSGTNRDWGIQDLRRFVNGILIGQNGATEKDLTIFMNDDVGDYYVQLWDNRGGYHEQGPKVDAWPYRTLYFQGIPILTDYFFLDNVIFAVDMSEMVHFKCTDMKWQNLTGGTMWEWIHDYDAYEAYTVERGEYGGYNVQRGGALWDVNGYSDQVPDEG